MSGVSEQPKPTGDGPIVWKQVDRDLRRKIKNMNDNSSGVEALEDIRDRVDFGAEKYGTVLRAFNGRDALQDSLEEAYDLVLYLKQLQIEKRCCDIISRIEKPEKVLITGGSGYIGFIFSDFLRVYTNHTEKDIDIYSFGSELDVTDRNEVSSFFEREQPDIVIHLAAKAETDWCEDPENFQKAISVNVDGTKNVVETALSHDADVVYFSSGCLYPTNDKWYGEDDWMDAKCNYTRTKLYAEEMLVENDYTDKILNVRLRQPFSNLNHERNLVTKINGYDELIDEQNSMTHLEQAVAVIFELVMRGTKGTYNITNKGTISPFEIATRYGQRRDVEKISYSKLMGKLDAVRVNSKVDCSKLRDHTGISLSCIHPAIHYSMNSTWEYNDFKRNRDFSWKQVYPLIEGQMFTKEFLLS